MHLFNNIKYQLSGQEIESIYNPGQASTMLGLLKYPDDFSKSVGLNQLWYKDTEATASIYIIIRHCPGVGAFPRPFCVPNSVALASLTLQVGDWAIH